MTRSAAACLLAALALAPTAGAAEPRDPAALGRWLEALGVPSPAGKTPIRVQPPEAGAPARDGRLLADEGERIVVLHGLAVWSYATGEHRGAPRWAPRSPDVALGEPWPAWIAQNASPSPALTLAAAAWVDWAEGRETAARRRFAEAAATRPEADLAALGRHLADEVPRVLVWAALGAAADAPWEAIRARLERIAAGATGPWAEQAAALAAELPGPRVRPEGVALGAALRDLGDPDPAALAAGLAHAPGPVDAVMAPIERCGPGAAPALLEALEDPTLTRVRRRTCYRPERALFRRGELARVALGRLAGSFLSTPAEARRWWAEVEAEGLLVHLRRDLESPSRTRDHRARRAARLLRKRTPEQGPALLVAAARRAPVCRPAVLHALARPPHAAATPLARAALRDPAADLGELIDAAEVLVATGSPVDAPAVARLSAAVAEALPTLETSPLMDPGVIARGARVEEALRLLVEDGASPRGLAAARRLYAGLPASAREHALVLAGRVPARPGFAGDRAEEAAALLVAALDDADPWRDDVALGELAAYLLAPRLGTTYDVAAPADARAAARAELRARWEATRGR